MKGIRNIALKMVITDEIKLQEFSRKTFYFSRRNLPSNSKLWMEIHTVTFLLKKKRNINSYIYVLFPHDFEF